MTKPSRNDTDYIEHPASRLGRASSDRIIRTGSHRGLLKRELVDRRKYLSSKDVIGIANAYEFGHIHLAPFDTALTVTWRLSANFIEENWSKIQTRLFTAIQEWGIERGVVVHFVWVRERQRGMGLHTHAMLHLKLPRRGSQRELEDLKSFLDKRFDFGPDGIHVQRLWSGKARSAGFLRYMTKAMDPGEFRYVGHDKLVCAEVLGIHNRGPQGLIHCKRVGFSTNIGPKARAAAGWIERRDMLAVWRILHGTNGEH